VPCALRPVPCALRPVPRALRCVNIATLPDNYVMHLMAN